MFCKGIIYCSNIVTRTSSLGKCELKKILPEGCPFGYQKVVCLQPSIKVWTWWHHFYLLLTWVPLNDLEMRGLSDSFTSTVTYWVLDTNNESLETGSRKGAVTLTLLDFFAVSYIHGCMTNIYHKIPTWVRHSSVRCMCPTMHDTRPIRRWLDSRIYNLDISVYSFLITCFVRVHNRKGAIDQRKWSDVDIKIHCLSV